jgi:serine/threonine protein kinase/tetratricopeptide (TPR) repeat protein
MIPEMLSHYRIQKKLGAGGMGEVYKALDTKLSRTVVVKVLPAELTAREANLKRFAREARLASSLDHPNICTIFDLDESAGIHFIAMQYIEGRTLRQVVDGRPLQLESALSIAIQVVDALAAAHARGIIHRDVKSGNVMVTDSGMVKVLDFGLAKLLDDNAGNAGGIHQTELTEIGVPYGTPTHAAPEQARGDPVDYRADIFSSGVILYEVLTGTWPFRGKTAIDVRHAVLHDTPEPLATARPGHLPPGLQSIMDRALAKEPRDRYQKMTDMAGDLRKVLAEISGPGSMAKVPQTKPARHESGSGPVARAFRWLRSITSSEPAGGVTGEGAEITDHKTPTTSFGDREKRTLAILPFKNMNNDAASAFYEFSLADAVITELARLRSLVVRPSSVIARYQGREYDPLGAGRELGVSAVLAAGFLQAGDRIRVTAQLLDVDSGDIIWSDRIDATSGDIVTLQDTIAQHIVDGLRLELSPGEQADLARPATHNPAAYEEYLRGRDLFARFIFRTVAAEDCDAAIKRFERAVELDSSFALAHDGLGACYANRVFKGLGSAEDYARAEVAFNRALSLDPQLVEARALMVFVHLWRGQKQKARDEVARLRREAPNEAVVYFVKATVERLDGEYERALRSYDRLAQLDPAAHVVASYNRAFVLIFMDRLDEALLELDRAGAVEPENPLLKTIRALALYYSGDAAAATVLMEEVVTQHPNLHGARPVLAICLAAQGRHEEARRQITEDVKRTASADQDMAYWLASAYALQGSVGDALEWLGRAIALGNANRPWFRKDPTWAGLRGDPQVRKLLESIGLRELKGLGA